MESENAKSRSKRGKETLHYVGERVVPNETPEFLVQEHLGRYIFAVQYTKGKKVLEVGCGTGVGSDLLLREGAKHLVAGDISVEALAFLNEHYSQTLLDPARFSACSFPFREKEFDVVVAFEVIEHIREYRNFLEETFRVLKDGGALLCSTPNKRIDLVWRSRPQGEFHVHEFFPEEFLILVRGLYGDVELLGQHPTTLIRRVGFSLFGLFSKVILCFPNGLATREKFVKVMRRATKTASAEAHFSKIKIDKKYAVTKFTENCSYLVAVAKRNQSDSRQIDL
jgi:2-polyprenyl-3-methyl-5-hydroxy-6-metoxy-1,4-benzoquinol methylase